MKPSGQSATASAEALLRDALAAFYEAFVNRGETTSLREWNNRLKAAHANALEALAGRLPYSAPSASARRDEIIEECAVVCEMNFTEWDGRPTSKGRRFAEAIRALKNAANNESRPKTEPGLDNPTASAEPSSIPLDRDNGTVVSGKRVEDSHQNAAPQERAGRTGKAADETPVVAAPSGDKDFEEPRSRHELIVENVELRKRLFDLEAAQSATLPPSHAACISEWNLVCPKCGCSPEGPCGWPSNCPTGLAAASTRGEKA